MTDSPISNAKADKLERKLLAKNFAGNIYNYWSRTKKDEASDNKYNENPGSLVFGIQGIWGEGKTSFKNMTREGLEEEEDLKGSIYMEFNPWLYSGQESLIKVFLKTLDEKMNPNSKFKIIRRAIAITIPIMTLAAIVCYCYFNVVLSNLFLSIIITVLSGVLACLWALKKWDILGLIANFITNPTDIEKYIKHIQKEKPLEDIKAKIKKEMSERDKPVFVFIDDIDRLTPVEVTQIFQLTKQMADFPNVIYILCYDKKQVSNALNVQLGTEDADADAYGYGCKYLEKIIPIETDLQNVNASMLEGIANDTLRNILDAEDYNLISSGRKYDSYEPTDKYIIINIIKTNNFKTVRSLKRFINNFNTGYNLVKNHVDCLDFLIIYYFKQFNKEIYNELSITGVIKSMEDILSKFDDKLNYKIKNILKYLGPTPATDKNIFKIDKNIYKIDKNIYKIDKNIYKRFYNTEDRDYYFNNSPDNKFMPEAIEANFIRLIQTYFTKGDIEKYCSYEDVIEVFCDNQASFNNNYNKLKAAIYLNAINEKEYKSEYLKNSLLSYNPKTSSNMFTLTDLVEKSLDLLKKDKSIFNDVISFINLFKWEIKGSDYNTDIIEYFYKIRVFIVANNENISNMVKSDGLDLYKAINLILSLDQIIFKEASKTHILSTSEENIKTLCSNIINTIMDNPPLFYEFLKLTKETYFKDEDTKTFLNILENRIYYYFEKTADNKGEYKGSFDVGIVKLTDEQKNELGIT